MRTPIIIAVIAFATTLTAATPILQLESAHAFTVRVPEVRITASGDNVYVVWDSNRTSTLKEIMFRASTDNGQTFSDKVNLSNSTRGLSDMANVAASGNNVFVTFGDNKTGNTEIYMRKSTDNGETFSEPIMLNSTGTLPLNLWSVETIPGLDTIRTEVSTSGDNTYVAWWDNKTGNWDIMFARSNDGGESLEDTINLSNSSNERSEKVKMATSGDNAYLTWWEISKNGTLGPAFVASNDNGQTFGPVLRLATNGSIGEASEGEEEGQD